MALLMREMAKLPQSLIYMFSKHQVLALKLLTYVNSFIRQGFCFHRSPKDSMFALSLSAITTLRFVQCVEHVDLIAYNKRYFCAASMINNTRHTSLRFGILLIS